MTPSPHDDADVARDRALGLIEVQVAIMARNTELLRRRSREPGELERAAYLILRALRRMGSADINGLAVVLGLDASTVGRQVGVLADEGLVDRAPDPGDRRRSVVSPSEEGLRRVALTSELRRGRTQVLLDEWESGDLDRFGELLRHYNAAVAAHYMTGLSPDET
jgi:DNA-binding MarR family transcriptional regulator